MTDLNTSSPTALILTLSINSLTTDSATSASNKADRTSFNASSTSFSVKAPRFVKPLKTLPSLSVKFSNILKPNSNLSTITPVLETQGRALL